MVEAGGRRARVVGVNTASSSAMHAIAREQNLVGYLDPSQVDDLIVQINADPTPVDHTIVFGHHPQVWGNGLGTHNTDEHLHRLIDATSAEAYLFGHVHLMNTSFDDGVFYLQGPTLGNPTFFSLFEQEFTIVPAGFCVLGLDESGPSMRRRHLNVSGASVSSDWPLVLITNPADPDLGGDNPRATPLERSSRGHVLRAGVFAPGEPASVVYRIDSGSWIPMERVEGWYEAPFDALDASSMRIEVQGLFEGAVDTHSITVNLV